VRPEIALTLDIHALPSLARRRRSEKKKKIRRRERASLSRDTAKTKRLLRWSSIGALGGVWVCFFVFDLY
jgi:hypothetical protein